MKITTSLMAIGLMALVSAVQGASPPASLVMIPPQINYQGRLVTTANVPYQDTTHTIDLVLYPTASGGTRIWGERYSVVTRDGYFSVNLGSGGTQIPGVTNPPIWQVLWKADGASPDNFFMALTVRTETNGTALVSPVEATPRQQFLTAPFAYRAHQSVYATKADGLFSAPAGVQTPSLSSTTNEISVNVPLRTVNGANGGTVYANLVQAYGTSPGLRMLNGGGPVALGVNYLGGLVIGGISHASQIYIGAQTNSTGPGSEISMSGRAVNISTPDFNFNSRALFVTKQVSQAVSTASTVTSVAHGINTSQYDVQLVGWYFSQSTPGVRAAYMYPDWTTGTIIFTSTPASGSVTLFFLGIGKGLVNNQ
jgi:hypothetical protein